MKKLIIYTSIITAILGCTNSDFYSVPEGDLANNCTTLVATKDAETLYNNTPTAPVVNTTADVLEGYVTSSDGGGNFYKSISMVTYNPTTNVVGRGFTVSIDATNTSNTYEPGRKVYIKLKDRSIMSRNTGGSSSLEIGSKDIEFPTTRIGRLNPVEIDQTIIRGCDKVNENVLVQKYTIAQAKNNANLHKLIEIDDVQFTDASVGKKYYDESVFTIGGATNHEIIGNVGTDKLTVRVSGFSDFASQLVNTKNGTIRGVLTKFGSGFQLLIRSVEDCKMTNPRFDSNPAVGGSAITYSGAFTENFESYTAGSVTTGQRNFPKYINDPAVGTKYWYTATFSANKYLVMSAFSSSTTFQDQDNKSYFIVPVDFTTANGMQFKTQDRFNNGAVLKVYYSSNYVPLGDINSATKTDITSNFTISSGTTGGTTTAFVNSGLYNFPASLTGNGFIIFEYTGGYSFNPDLTTTIHLDDIVVN
jgi:hypothetical protein